MNDRYKADRERLRILWEMEKPKNFYTTHGHELMLVGEGCQREAGYRAEGDTREKKNGTTVIA